MDAVVQEALAAIDRRAWDEVKTLLHPYLHWTGTMMGLLSEKLDHVELDGDVEYAQSHFVSGVKHLPITYRFT